MKKGIALIFMIACFTQLFSQKRKRNFTESSKFFVSIGGGQNLPLNKSKNTPARVLYQFNQDYFTSIAVTYFAHKTWGFEASLKPGIVNDKMPDSAFYKSLEKEYGSKYRVSAASGVYDYMTNNILLQAGPVYKLQKGRFMAVPKLLLGINVLDGPMRDGYVTLEEKNGSEVRDITYLPERSPYVSFVMSPSCSFYFKLSRRFGINFSANYSLAPWVKRAYTETTYSYKTQESQSNYHSDYKSISFFSIGGGLTFFIK